ncbi:hypothetical protein PLEOSDRAFT_1075675 [Pleurotus ostreatus PC15]|uniref:Tc1-like transposase DDE domain-containing protein n=1 Tax=Pleurotus ostreatus (strain PC15) TaxID=1137138 RepID=A0A067NX84_PLEO1|nr:hypothetical protein PLEOSDRAFT_1075675 [Pleurotus ostreatus PC15]
MDILQQDYADEIHVFVYDNAQTHQKRPDGSLSARKMPKNIPKQRTNWGVEVTARDGDGKVIHGADGKPLKKKIKMSNGTLKDGQTQDLYFLKGHERAGVFKGMAVILQERGYGDMSKVRAKCAKFKCAVNATNCCCRRMLYNEADFKNVRSLLEMQCEKRGFDVHFLLKFHCELNPIEQCWGHAKCVYQLNPPSSKVEDLERNMVAALDSVSLEQIRRYSRRCRRFIDAYRKGLDGKQAAWANKKYQGHWVLPESLLYTTNGIS